MHTGTTYLTAILLLLSTLALATPTTAHGDCDHLHPVKPDRKDLGNPQCVPDDPGGCDDGSICTELLGEAERCVNDRAYCDASVSPGACGDDDVLVEATVLGTGEELCVRDETARRLVDLVVGGVENLEEFALHLVELVQNVEDRCTDHPPEDDRVRVHECQLEELSSP